MKKKRDTRTIEEKMLDLVDPEPTEMDIDEIMRLGRENPLPRDQAIRLMKKCVLALRAGCERRGDKKGLKSLEGDIDTVAARIVDNVEKKRKKQ